MRMLILHVDHFRCSLTEKGRSKVVEKPASKTKEAGESLLVLSSVEKQDEADPKTISQKAVDELSRLARQLKVDTIVVHPFAHLFGDLSSTEAAIEILTLIAEGLAQLGFMVLRTPFGWFNTLELRAKGHPLSRIARQITLG